jgi:hypothetical protein
MNKRKQTLSHLLAKLLDCFSSTEMLRWGGSKTPALGFAGGGAEARATARVRVSLRGGGDRL